MSTTLVQIIITVSLFIIGLFIKIFTDIASLKTNIDNVKDNQKELKQELLQIRSDFPTIIQKVQV